MIEFISSEKFPDDNYTKELVYLQINGVRYGFVSKMTKQGNLFWDEISCGITVNGEKKYFKAFKFDSEFLKDDIYTVLKSRSWEKSQKFMPQNAQINYPYVEPKKEIYDHVDAKGQPFQDELPF